MVNRFKVVYSFGAIQNVKEFPTILSIENWFNGSFLYPTYLSFFRIYDIDTGEFLCSLTSTKLYYKVYFTKKHGLLKIKKNKNYV